MKKVLILVLLVAPGCKSTSLLGQLPLYSNGDTLPEDQPVRGSAKPGDAPPKPLENVMKYF